MKKTEELVKIDDVNESLIQIRSELKGSFNLSDEKSRNEYIKLRYYDRLLQSISELQKDKKHVTKSLGGLVNNVLNHILNYPWIRKKSKNKSVRSEEEQPLIDPIIKKREEELFQIAKTNNNKYREDLAALAYAIDEEDIPILFYGEVGVGKSFLAEKIHSISKRNKKKFITVDCAGMSETNLYPNLFGALKGSFTGSIRDLKGMISEAEGGTLFIDEIDKAPKSIRYHLKTFIDTKKYYPLGSENYKSADVRIIVGTNKDLRQLIKKGEFEDDLYSRLSGRIIHIPPLRERKEDIPILINSVINVYNAKCKNPLQITIEALEYLINFPWPQNTRQLEYYLNMMFGDCSRGGYDALTLEMINQKPPETFYTAADFDTFESVIKDFLENWELNNGKYLADFVEPVVSKIYLEDYNPHMNQSKKYESAMDILGISGDRRTDSTLYKQYLKYEDIKKKLS